MGKCKECKHYRLGMKEVEIEDDFNFLNKEMKVVGFCNKPGWLAEIENTNKEKYCFKSKEKKEVKSTTSNDNPYYKLIKKEEREKVTEVNVKKKNNNESICFGYLNYGRFFIYENNLYIKKNKSGYKLKNGIKKEFDPMMDVQKPKKVNIEWE